MKKRDNSKQREEEKDIVSRTAGMGVMGGGASERKGGRHSVQES